MIRITRKKTLLMLLVGLFLCGCSPSTPTVAVLHPPTISTEDRPEATSTPQILATSVLTDSINRVVYDQNNWTYYPLDDHIPSNAIIEGNHVYSIVVEADNNIWLGTSFGLWHFSDNQWLSYTKKDGMPSNHARPLVIASDGTIWMGFDNGITPQGLPLPKGVASFDGNNWHVYEFPDSFAALAAGPNGDIWAAALDQRTENGQATAWHYNDSQWEKVVLEDEEYYEGWENEVRSIAVAPDNTIWFGTDRRGVIRYANGQWTQFSPEIFLNLIEYMGGYWSVRNIEVAQDGTVWASVGLEGGGVAHFDGNHWFAYPINSAFLALNVSDDGRVWVGGLFDPLVSYMEDGRWYSFDGLPFKHVYDITTAPDDTVWFGTEKGLYIYDEN